MKSIDRVEISVKNNGKFHYEAIFEDGTSETVRNESGREYKTAYYYGGPGRPAASGKSGLAKHFSFGKRPASHMSAPSATFDIMSAAQIQEQQMADEFDNSEYEVEHDADQRHCLCGCGQPVDNKRNFRQGHDMKLKSIIKNSPASLTVGQKMYAKVMWPAICAKYIK